MYYKNDIIIGDTIELANGLNATNTLMEQLVLQTRSLCITIRKN